MGVETEDFTGWKVEEQKKRAPGWFQLKGWMENVFMREDSEKTVRTRVRVAQLETDRRGGTCDLAPNPDSVSHVTANSGRGAALK